MWLVVLPGLSRAHHSFIHSFSGCPLIDSLPGPVLEVGDREGNQTQALHSRSSPLDAGTDTCHRSCAYSEGTFEPGLGARKGFTEEECSGVPFGIGWRMRSTSLIASAAIHAEGQPCKGPEAGNRECMRTVGVSCVAWNSEGWECLES